MTFPVHPFILSTCALLHYQMSAGIIRAVGLQIIFFLYHLFVLRKSFFKNAPASAASRWSSGEGAQCSVFNMYSRASEPNSSSQAFPNGHFDQNKGLCCSPEVESSGACLLLPLSSVQVTNARTHLLQGDALQNMCVGLALGGILSLLFSGQLGETLFTEPCMPRSGPPG